MASSSSDNGGNRMGPYDLPYGHIHIKTCGICGGSGIIQLFSVPGRVNQQVIKYKIVQCQDCGVAFLTPRPSGQLFDIIYPSDDYYAYQNRSLGVRGRLKEWTMRESSPGDGGGGAGTWVRRKVARMLSSQVMTFIHAAEGNQRLLDIGCGSGEFLQQARSLGWQVWGVEPSKVAAEKAKAQGLQVFCGELKEALFPTGFFDVICLSHVIEHLEDPLMVLLECRRLLRDAGKLLVVTPNFECFDRYTFGLYWKALDIPRHLWFFSPQTLEEALKRSGFHVESLRLALLPHKPDDLTVMSFRFLLRDWCNQGVEIGLTLAKAVMRTFFVKPWLYLMPGKRELLGDTMSVVASKISA